MRLQAETCVHAIQLRDMRTPQEEIRATLGPATARGWIRATSFEFMLIHKPAYRFWWGETVVGRNSQKPREDFF